MFKKCELSQKLILKKIEDEFIGIVIFKDLCSTKSENNDDSANLSKFKGHLSISNFEYTNVDKRISLLRILNLSMLTAMNIA